MAIILEYSDLRERREIVLLHSMYYELCVRESQRTCVLMSGEDIGRFSSYLDDVNPKSGYVIPTARKETNPRAFFFGNTCPLHDVAQVLDRCTHVNNIGLADFAFTAFLFPKQTETSIGFAPLPVVHPAALSRAQRELTITIIGTMKGRNRLPRTLDRSDPFFNHHLCSSVVRLVFTYTIVRSFPLQLFTRLTHLAFPYNTTDVNPLEMLASLPQLRALVYLFPHGHLTTEGVPILSSPTRKTAPEEAVIRRHVFEDRRISALQCSYQMKRDSSEFREGWKTWANGRDLWETAQQYMASEARHIVRRFCLRRNEALEPFLTLPLGRQPLDPRMPNTSIYSMVKELHFHPDITDVGRIVSCIERLPNLSTIGLEAGLIGYMPRRQNISEMVVFGAADLQLLLESQNLPSLTHLVVPADSLQAATNGTLDQHRLKKIMFFDASSSKERSQLSASASSNHPYSPANDNLRILLRHIFCDRRLLLLHSSNGVYVWSFAYGKDSASNEKMWSDAEEYTAREAKKLCEDHIEIASQDNLGSSIDALNMNVPLAVASHCTPASLITRLCIDPVLDNLSELDDILTSLPRLTTLAVSHKRFRELFERRKGRVALADNAGNIQVSILNSIPSQSKKWPHFSASKQAMRISHLVLVKGVQSGVHVDWSAFSCVRCLAFPFATLPNVLLKDMAKRLPHLRNLTLLVTPMRMNYRASAQREKLFQVQRGHIRRYINLLPDQIHFINSPQGQREYLKVFKHVI